MTLSAVQQKPAGGGYDAGPAFWWGLGAVATVVALAMLTPSRSCPVNGLATAWFLGGPGNVAFLVGGYGFLLVTARRHQNPAIARAVLVAFLLVTLIVQLQKLVFHGWLLRPSGNGGGFPSGHAAGAFTVAFLLALLFPRWSPVGYGLAVAISWSRIATSSHFPYQVVAGAATGYLIALLLSHRLARCDYCSVILPFQSLIVMGVPFIALCSFSHEFEDDFLLVVGTALPVLAGVVLRIWPYLRCCAEPRGRIMRYAGNTLICAGVTLGLELPWLVPLEVLVCLTVYTLAERKCRSPVQSKAAPVPGLLPEISPVPGRNRVRLPRLLHKRWVGEIAWTSLWLLVVLKEMMASGPFGSVP